MKEYIQPLLENRWILKKDNPELYYQIKDHNKEISKFLNDKFGYNLIMHPSLVKIEKVPSVPEEWMGIQEFKDIKDYQMFCYILMFLEDKEEEFQFLLSQICEYIQLQFHEDKIDWNVLKTRRQLIRALQYATSIGLITMNDGDEDSFLKNQTGEVLYENLGVSRYYMRNFVFDITKYHTIADFQESEFLDGNKDKGILRRWNVYRNLLLSLGLYKQDNETAYDYVIRYRNTIEQDFKSLFDCDLFIHDSSAYIILDDDEKVGKVFPNTNQTLDDLLMIVFQNLYERVEKYQLQPDENEMLHIPLSQFNRIVIKLIKENTKFLPKKYKGEAMREETLANQITEWMIHYGIAYLQEDTIHIYPLVGKIQGTYGE